MGAGELQMRNWGYASAGVGLVMVILVIVLSSLLMAVRFGSVEQPQLNTFGIMAIVALILAVGGGVVYFFAIPRIQAADDVYTQSVYKKNRSPAETVIASNVMASDDVFAGVK